MKKGNSTPRPLVEAAERLEASLALHGKATRELLRLTLDSRRDVAKADEVVARLTANEQELAASMQGFVAVLAEASTEQQANAEQTQARALELAQRRAQLEALDGRLSLLVEAVKSIRALLEALKDSGGAGIGDVLGQLRSLVELSKGVSADAHAQSFEDVGIEAHALHQQLETVLRKAETLEHRMPRA